MTTTRRPLSVLDPLTPAVERMRTVLFRPFDLGRWLVIGFCAWLAMLGQGGGGGGGNFNLGNRLDGRSLRQGLDQARDYLVQNFGWILPLAVGLILLAVLLWVLIIWLSSRGQFMFLHCVATNRAEVRVPWAAYRAQGNSLCLFRLLLGLASFLIIAPAIAGTVVLVLGMVLHEHFSWPHTLAAAACLLAAIGLGVVYGVIAKLTRDFVVPVMALQGMRCRTAWSEFLRLTQGNRGNLVLYLLFQVLLTIVIGAGVLVLVLLTCCVAGCLLALPYLGTVLLLPVLVFDRAYSLLYLAQFGPEWDAFASSARSEHHMAPPS